MPLFLFIVNCLILSISSALLRYTWQIKVYLKCTMWWFEIHIHCERILTIKLTHPSLYIFTFFFLFLVRTLKLYSFSKFQLYNTILSTVVTMLYIRCSDFTHHWEFVPFYQTSLIFSNNSLWQPPFYSLISISLIFLILHISDTMQYLSLSVQLISLRIMPFHLRCCQSEISFFFDTDVDDTDRYR